MCKSYLHICKCKCNTSFLGVAMGTCFCLIWNPPSRKDRGSSQCKAPKTLGMGFLRVTLKSGSFCDPPPMAGIPRWAGQVAGVLKEACTGSTSIRLRLCAQGTSVSRGIFTYTLLFSYSFLRRMPGHRQQSVACFQCIPVSGAGDSRFF